MRGNVICQWRFHNTSPNGSLGDSNHTPWGSTGDISPGGLGPRMELEVGFPSSHSDPAHLKGFRPLWGLPQGTEPVTVAHCPPSAVPFVSSILETTRVPSSRSLGALCKHVAPLPFHPAGCRPALARTG